MEITIHVCYLSEQHMVLSIGRDLFVQERPLCSRETQTWQKGRICRCPWAHGQLLVRISEGSKPNSS